MFMHCIVRDGSHSVQRLAPFSNIALKSLDSALKLKFATVSGVLQEQSRFSSLP